MRTQTRVLSSCATPPPCPTLGCEMASTSTQASHTHRPIRLVEPNLQTAHLRSAVDQPERRGGGGGTTRDRHVVRMPAGGTWKWRGGTQHNARLKKQKANQHAMVVHATLLEPACRQHLPNYFRTTTPARLGHAVHAPAVVDAPGAVLALGERRLAPRALQVIQPDLACPLARKAACHHSAPSQAQLPASAHGHEIGQIAGNIGCSGCSAL